MRSQRPSLKVKNLEQGKICRISCGQPPDPSFVVGCCEIGVQNPFSTQTEFIHPRPCLVPRTITGMAVNHFCRLPPGTASVKGVLDGKRSLEALGIRGHMKKFLQNLRSKRVLLGSCPAGGRDMFPHFAVPNCLPKLVGKQNRCVQPDHSRSKNPSAKLSRPDHGSLMCPTEAGSVACQRGVLGFAEFLRKFSIASRISSEVVRFVRRASL